MRVPAFVAPLVLTAAVAAALFGVVGGAAAACAGEGCVTFEPAAAAPGVVVTVTPADGNKVPLIQSTDCAPGARINADFVREGVVVALSPLNGSPDRATFRVPSTPPGSYRIDLYCPDGNAAVTLQPNFQVLAPETSTLPASIATDSNASPMLALTFLLALVFAIVVLPAARARASGVAAVMVRHVQIGAVSAGYSDAFLRHATRVRNARPRSSIRTERLRRR